MKLKITAIALVLLAAACGGDDDGAAAGAAETDAPTTTAAQETTTEAPAGTEAPAATGPSVAVSASGLGDIITDGNGDTLYLFTPDAQGPSVCYDECASAWPPLVGDVTAGDGIDSALLGTVARDDGGEQVTYNGWPLYYFAADASPGDVNGQGVNDVWFVLDAAGNGIGLPEAAPAGSVVAVAASSLGDILVDGEGNTLYLFTPDAQGPSTCSDGCAAAWPPLVDEVTAGDGVDGSLLGTTERADGSVQVTYNGWPLYYFTSDASPGDVNGQGANDVWFVVSPAGDAVGQ